MLCLCVCVSVCVCICSSFRGRVPWLSLTGGQPSALGGLSEEQGHQGGALAHTDQSAAGIHTAGLDLPITAERWPVA